MVEIDVTVTQSTTDLPKSAAVFNYDAVIFSGTAYGRLCLDDAALRTLAAALREIPVPLDRPQSAPGITDTPDTSQKNPGIY